MILDCERARANLVKPKVSSKSTAMALRMTARRNVVNYKLKKVSLLPLNNEIHSVIIQGNRKANSHVD